MSRSRGHGIRPRAATRIVATLMLATALLPSGQAAALEIRTGREAVVGPGETLEDDVYLFGETVIIDGKVDGDVMANGLDIVLRGEVTGDLTGCARSIVIDGIVGDDVRIAGAAVTLNHGSRIGDDLMSAGLSLESARGSSILGSLGFVGYQARLAGDVGEDLGAEAVGVELVGGVAGEVDVAVESEGGRLPRGLFPRTFPIPEVAPGLTLGSSASVGGDLSYRSAGEALIESGARIEGRVRREKPAVEAAGRGDLLGRVERWAAMILIGGSLLWLVPLLGLIAETVLIGGLAALGGWAK